MHQQQCHTPTARGVLQQLSMLFCISLRQQLCLQLRQQHVGCRINPSECH
jgi:hypothetical protein